ncbi:MAG: apolipoprotein N-acyltransferase [Cellvibrionaceae bacterium]
MAKLTHYSHWLPALISGALLPLSLAPFDVWPLAIISCGALFSLLQNQPAKTVFIRSFFYGLGLFGVGVSWVFVSIYTYGQTALPLAVFMTLLFVSFLAIVFALPWWLIRKKIPYSGGYWAILFTALWLLVEWLRTWLLTGFPWLFAGYSQLHTPLAGWAPIVGVLGLGALIAFTGAITVTTVKCFSEKHFSAIKFSLPIIAAFWLAGFFFQQLQWTEDSNSPLKVNLVQGNVGLFEKWDYRNHPAIIERYISLTQPLWEDSDIILWPENAIPLIHHEADWLLEEIDQHAKETHTNFLMGILTYDFDKGRYYNTMISLGKGEGQYYKRRLVPFGEYMPLEDILRGLINFFDLPLSIIIPGPSEQTLLKSHKHNLASLICYEIAYPDLTARTSRNSAYLMTVSNDAWFNDSIAPQQHLQLAQMRALETQRYLIRGTNNGVSAIVNPDGTLQSIGPQFETAVIKGSITPREGATPFMLWGSWPVVILALIVLIVGWRRESR